MLLKRRFPVLFLAGCFAMVAAPVEFQFSVPADPAVKNPFAREIWAEVTTPSGRALRLPAFYVGSNIYVVRARPIEAGAYHLGLVSESTPGHVHENLTAKSESPADVTLAAKDRMRLPSIRVDPRDPHRFLRSDGHPFFPIGADLAWPEGDNPNFYADAFAAFAKNNLNWTRVWMVHWGQLNLDWVPDWAGGNPPLGGLDGKVGQRWDDLLASAEEHGVYVQVTLQHHGQYTSKTDSNWDDNPWNAAKGGFLKSPEEFFTSPRARLMTAIKYRYIVARYGWSPAVFSWELFNEVHWTDSMVNHHEDQVAEWHSAMAALLRSVDVYHHMVTTSTENLRSPIYAQMDYYQPHLYAANLLDAAGRFDPPAASLEKPVFWGEEGDDHLPVSDAVRKTGVTLVPPSWAALMGQSMLPAQPWEGAKLIATGRLGELGAVHRFAVLSHYLEHPSSESFSPVVDCPVRVPLSVRGGQYWTREVAPELALPTDGREEPAVALVPTVLVGSPGSLADGYPGRVTYHIDMPRAATGAVHVRTVGAAGGALRVLVDGGEAAGQDWSDPKAAGLPASVPFALPKGAHTVVIENPGAPDWVEISSTEFGLDIPALAAVGRRDPTFVAVWLWRRDAVFSPETVAPAGGTLDLDTLPSGAWSVTWWDTVAGKPGIPVLLQHPGGPLRLPVPPIARHAAVVLTRKP